MDRSAWLVLLTLTFSGMAWAEGDAARGRAVVASRQTGLCLLCHSAPIAEQKLQGNLATNLAGAGSRWTAEQLRQRIADGLPGGLMPAYGRVEGLDRVGANWQGKPILEPQQIEDVVAYLLTLK